MDLEEAKQRLSEISDEISKDEEQLRELDAKLAELAPGDINNALFDYVRAFIPDETRVKELEEKYAAGDNIGDGHVKVEVAEAIDQLLEPMRARRAEYDGPAGDEKILELLREHTQKANEAAEETLYEAKKAMRLDFGRRTLSFS